MAACRSGRSRARGRSRRARADVRRRLWRSHVCLAQFGRRHRSEDERARRRGAGGHRPRRGDRRRGRGLGCQCRGRDGVADRCANARASADDPRRRPSQRRDGRWRKGLGRARSVRRADEHRPRSGRCRESLSGAQRARSCHAPRQAWRSAWGPSGSCARTARSDASTRAPGRRGAFGPEAGLLTSPRAIQRVFSDIAFGFGSFWFANRAENVIVEVDSATNQNLGRPVTVGRAPTAIAVGADSCGSRTSTTIRCPGLSSRGAGHARTVDNIPVGDGPVDVAVGEGGVWIASSRDRRSRDSTRTPGKWSRGSRSGTSPSGSPPARARSGSASALRRPAVARALAATLVVYSSPASRVPVARGRRRRTSAASWRSCLNFLKSHPASTRL